MSRRFGAVPPGPQLGGLLGAFQVGALPDEQLLDFLKGEYRQLAFQHARVWAAMAEIARRSPLSFDRTEEWTPERIFDSAVAEIVAELRVSRCTAERELHRGLELERMPRIATALAAGDLDRTKAIVLLEACGDLSEKHRMKVLDEILPSAATVRVSAMKARVQRLAIALDPGWAERRYREAIRTRKVVTYLADDGTVTLAAENQPADEALAAKARLTSVVEAAKRAGADAPLDILRSVLLLGLANLKFVGMSESQIIDQLVAEFPKAAAEPDHPTEQLARANAPAPQSAEPESAEPESAEPESAEPESAEPDPQPEPEPEPEPESVAPSASLPSGVELRVGLATLMGLDDHPAEVAGTGPVIAPVARDLAERQRRGEWRFAVVDHEGLLLGGGITRHRPSTYRPGGERGGLVELHVPLHLLDPAFIEEHAAWAKLLTDVASHYAKQAPIVQDPAARLPGKRLRRHVEVKHRYCVFPGCRRPAADSQIDHRRDWAKGGVTLEKNLGSVCRHHHDLKTRRGWRLTKRDSRTYVWISPLGRKHLVKIEPVAPPLPDPPRTSAD